MTSSQKSMGSMLDMLKNMMEGGRDVGEGQQQPGSPGNQPGQSGQQPGQSGKGGKGGANQGGEANNDNTAENDQRRVPRSSGSAGSSLPKEFHKAMDAYNRGVGRQTIKPVPEKPGN